MLFKDNWQRSVNRALHGAIPFCASLLLLLFTWLSRHTWVLWEVIVLAAITLLFPSFIAIIKNRRTYSFSLTQSLFFMLLGGHLNMLMGAFESFYCGLYHEPIGLIPSQSVAMLICLGLYYHNHLKEKALQRDCPPLSCWSFESQAGSMKRMLLFLNHYAASNGLFCFFIVMIFMMCDRLSPDLSQHYLGMSLILFFCAIIAWSLFCYAALQARYTQQAISMNSPLFFLLTLGLIPLLLSWLDIIPTHMLWEKSEIGNWLSSPFLKTENGQVLSYAAAISLICVFILGGLQILKTEIDKRWLKSLVYLELALWILPIFCCFIWPHLHHNDLSLQSIKISVAKIFLLRAKYTLPNHPLGLMLLAIPFYSGLTRQFKPHVADYFFIFIGINSIPALLLPPDFALYSFTLLIILNIAQSRHIIYACDAPWEHCSRTQIKAQRWIFPITLSCWLIFIAHFIIPKQFILAIIENFGLLFLFSLISISLLEVSLMLEHRLKNWYSNKHQSSELLVV